MSVRVQLDRPNGDIYTNLNFVTGRVILTLPTDATISAITVKLEGESKTRLDGPRSAHDQERKKTLLEIHKLLYKVETVFPTPELREVGPYNTNRTSQYTLLRGQYEYPFQFKIPLNSDCISNTSLMKDLKVGQLSVQFGQEPLHAKFPLPPSLTGYPGEAEIKYFVKATVVRPKFYQENLRNEMPIAFLPIESPRSAAQDGETYGRRKHQFQRTDSGNTVRRKSSLFRQNSNTTSPLEEDALAFQVDVRLPNPAIVTCREPLPLRILIERLNNSTSTMYLSMLQIELIGRTDVRAYDLTRKESGTWLLVSLANLSVPLEHPSNKSNSWAVPTRFWDTIPLPSNIVPSFRTCNLSRKYELEVRVGLTHGMADGVRPEIIVSPIRLDVEVFSGIRPPSQLLDAMAQAQQNQAQSHQQMPSRLNTAPNVNVKPNGQTQSSQQPTNSPQTPLHPQSQSPSSSYQYAPPPGRPDSIGNVSGMNDDLPPSYEDTIAEDLAPVDGPRPSDHAENSASTPQPPAFNPDSKSGLGRRASERLFARNAPRYSSGTSNRTNRVTTASATADLSSQFGGDTVHEEPDDLDESMNRMEIREEPSTEHRPPLPQRKTGEQERGVDFSVGTSNRKKQAEV